MQGVSPESMAMLNRMAARRAKNQRQVRESEPWHTKGGYAHVQWNGHIGGWGYRK